jgi:two-component system chemotaxis response regulator CheB
MPINVEALPRTVVTIGASAGGVEALTELFSKLPADLPGTVAAVIHRSPIWVSALPAVLGRRAAIPITEAADGEAIQHGRVYLAPADRHLRIERDRFRLHRGPKVHFTRPAVDPLFESAAAAYAAGVVGVLLSGGGDDGVSGLIAIKRAGGVTLVQHPVEAAHPWMPTNAIVYDQVDGVLPLDRMATTLVTLARGGVVDHELERSGHLPARRRRRPGAPSSRR